MDVQKELHNYIEACYNHRLNDVQKKEISQAFLSGMLVGIQVLNLTEDIVNEIANKLKEIGSLP